VAGVFRSMSNSSLRPLLDKPFPKRHVVDMDQRSAVF
jgi:hypothetical protein